MSVNRLRSSADHLLQRNARCPNYLFKFIAENDLKPYDRVKEELSVLEGVVLRGNRIVVPQSLQKQILTDLVEQEVGTETKESNDSTESGATASDACDNTKPSSPVVKQATQTDEDVVTTKSGP